MRRWSRRKAILKPPPAPEPERMEEARRAARDAHQILGEVLSQEPSVEARAEKAARIHRENHLGHSVWRVMEGRKA